MDKQDSLIWILLILKKWTHQLENYLSFNKTSSSSSFIKGCELCNSFAQFGPLPTIPLYIAIIVWGRLTSVCYDVCIWVRFSVLSSLISVIHNGNLLSLLKVRPINKKFDTKIIGLEIPYQTKKPFIRRLKI